MNEGLISTPDGHLLPCRAGVRLLYKDTENESVAKTREESNCIERSNVLGCRMDELVGKKYKILAFRELPVAHQLAIAHYLANDCDSWELFYDGDHVLLHEYVREYGEMLFGVIDLPAQRLKQAVMANPEIAAEHTSWEEYSAWYCGVGDVPEHGHENRWPVILSQDNCETLLDGWHRFHSYMRSGCSDVSAVFFPAERH